MTDREPHENKMLSPREAIKLAESCRGIARKYFANSPSSEIIFRAVTTVIQNAENAEDNWVQSHPSSIDVSCKVGCSHCCQMRVPVTAPETIYLVAYLSENCTSDEISSLLIRARHADDITHGMSEEEWCRADIACPLLVNGKCMAYAARPLECRGYRSFDESACKNILKNPSNWSVPLDLGCYAIYKNIQAGLISAAGEVGLPFEVLELTAALVTAMETDDAATQWASGEPVFNQARIQNHDPEALALLPWSPTIEVT